MTTARGLEFSLLREKGLLRKLCVNAEIINISSSPIAMRALLAGELDVIVSLVTTLVDDESQMGRNNDHVQDAFESRKQAIPKNAVSDILR
jgi:hypothetical protein